MSQWRSTPEGRSWLRVTGSVTVAVVVMAALFSALLAPREPGKATVARDRKERPERTAPATPPAPASSPRAAPPRAAPLTPAVPDSIQHQAETPGRAVNITFDDGPDPRWTPQILDVLRWHHVHATFCMIGPQALAHPDLVRRVVDEGHRLCDHTVHHDTTMNHKPLGYQESETLDALAMIQEASGGARVEYFRAPGGAFTPGNRARAARNGMRPLGWNVDTKDYEEPGVTAILRTLREEIHNGPTILFHDGGGYRGQTVEALDLALTWLRAHGYAFSFPKVG